jgi:hypothetical protein
MKFRALHRSLFHTSALIPLLCASVHAQGKEAYCNFEYQPVKPVAVAHVDGLSPMTMLLVCNTPDSSVEVYRIDGASRRDNPEFKARIPVGLEPVSVTFHSWEDQTDPVEIHNMMYTANALGDSVTIVELLVTGISNPKFSYRVRREVRVTDPIGTQDGLPFDFTSNDSVRCDDEPMHIAVVDRPAGSGRYLLVAKAGASSYSKIDRYTGAPLAMEDSSGCRPQGGANVIMAGTTTNPSGGAQVLFGSSLSSLSEQDMALKEPRMIAVRPNTDEYWVLGHKGGSTSPDGTGFDFDLWGIRPSDITCGGGFTPPTLFGLGGLGTTNFSMAFDPDGDFLYVVGTDASADTQGNGNLLGVKSGFVRSMSYRLDMSTNPPTVGAINLNLLNPSDPNSAAVAGLLSMSHPTDVVVYRDPTPKDYLCVPAFNSDRIAIVDVATGLLKRVVVEDPALPIATRDQTIAGPRGLALLTDGVAANHRIYVANSLDSSFTIISPNTTVGNPIWIAKVPLQRTTQASLPSTPTPVVPTYITDGRKFLYSTAFSGSRFVSCASCHVDSRLDQLMWRLSNSTTMASPDVPVRPSNIGVDYQDRLELYDPNDTKLISGFPDSVLALEHTMPNDGPGDDPLNPVPADANAKGPKVTQSLQGLVNFEVGGDFFSQASGSRFDDLVSNAPYHWRGDKDSFREFNEAFHNLQGMPNLVSGLPLTDAEMAAYESFINSIHYPPNALEPLERTASGDRWTEETSSHGTGSGATRGHHGMMLFHILASGNSVNGFPLEFKGLGNQTPSGSEQLLGRSCVQCHFLPEGSNNRITCLEDPSGMDIFGALSQPIESTALRGMFSKESLLELTSNVTPHTSPLLQTGAFGLGHNNTRGESRNVFHAFATGGPGRNAQLKAIVQFTRELDSGVAPIVGFSETVFVDAVNTNLDRMELEARKGNCGVAVFGYFKNGSTYTQKGYWLKFNATGLPLYKESGAAVELVRSGAGGMLAPLLTSDANEVFIFRATPLGMERRVASLLTGIPETLSAVPAPSVEIVGTIPNSFYAPINDPDPSSTTPPLSQNWKPGLSPDLVWAGLPSHLPHTLQLARRLQSDLGVADRHDAPRRLQVKATEGSTLQHGARIRISLHDGAGPRKVLELPIYPTGRLDPVHGRLWETAVEFDPTSLYILVAGGPGRSAVQCVIDSADPATSTCGSVALSGSTDPEAPIVEASNDGVSWGTPLQQVIPYPPIFQNP